MAVSFIFHGLEGGVFEVFRVELSLVIQGFSIVFGEYHIWIYKQRFYVLLRLFHVKNVFNKFSILYDMIERIVVYRDNLL